MSKSIKWKPAILASMALVVAAAGIPQAVAAQSDSASQASSGRLSILDDPAYQAYLRWNGFPVGPGAEQSSAGRGAASRPGIAPKAGPLSILDEPAYHAYLRWNGFPAGSALDQPSAFQGAASRVGIAPKAGPLNTLDDPAYRAYRRWNGFLAE